MKYMLAKVLSFAFGDRINFLFEKLERGVLAYGEVSLAEEKMILAQKSFQCTQLCWVAGKAGA